MFDLVDVVKSPCVALSNGEFDQCRGSDVMTITAFEFPLGRYRL